MQRKIKIKSFGIFKSIYRYVYHKIIIPIKRERRGPEYIARGTAVGIFFGLTPIIWQMNFVLLFWLIMRYFKWNFSLPIGLAWTWISNTVTNLPLFYLYYITGQFVTGKESSGGYSNFIGHFRDGIWQGIKFIITNWGVSIVIGSAIYMVIGSVIGYLISYKYAKYRQIKKDAKAPAVVNTPAIQNRKVS